MTLHIDQALAHSGVSGQFLAPGNLGQDTQESAARAHCGTPVPLGKNEEEACAPIRKDAPVQTKTRPRVHVNVWPIYAPNT